MANATQAFIGSDRNGNQTYASTNAGVLQALQAGYRWLIFREPTVAFTGTLDLDDSTIVQNNPSRILRFEGAASALDSGSSGGRTLFQKQVAASLIKCSTTKWNLDWSGLTFTGEGTTGDYPLVDMGQVEESRIIDCAFIKNTWDGASFGVLGSSALAKRLHFENCQFDGNYRNCLALGNAVWVCLHKCTFANFGLSSGDWAGVYYQGPASGNSEYVRRGMGTIEECYFSNAYSTNSGIWAVRARALDVVACVFDKARFRLDSTTAECWAYRCRYLNGATFDNTAGGTDNFDIDATGMGVNTCVST